MRKSETDRETARPDESVLAYERKIPRPYVPLRVRVLRFAAIFVLTLSAIPAALGAFALVAAVADSDQSAASLSLVLFAISLPLALLGLGLLRRA